MSQGSRAEAGSESLGGGAKHPQDKSENIPNLEPEQDKKPELEFEKHLGTGTHLSSNELGKLGWSHWSRFGRFGDPNDIEKAIEYGAQARDLTPEGHPDKPRRLADLGVFYTDRFGRLGGINDLEKSIELKSRALALTPNNHPGLSRRHAELGVSYTDRFRRLGELDDLEKSIELKSRALQLTPNGDPDLPLRHAELGVSYSDQFGRLGELGDLEKAIEHISRALALTPNGHPSLLHRHAELGIIYNDRFRRLGELNDLEKAIEHKSCALRLTPSDHPYLSRRHAELGVSYSDRQQLLGQLDDLGKAIEHFSCALALTPDGHPDLAHRHAELGVPYTHRFQLLGEIDDLEKSIAHKSHALALTPDGHPMLPDRYFNKALSFLLLFERTGDPSHLSCSLESFRRASQLATGAPRTIFQNAFTWANIASQHDSLNCIEPYGITIDLLPQFVWLGASTAQRYQDLSIAESLAVQAASAAIRYSYPGLALEWLEHARCVVWNQSLMLRSPLDQLQLSHPDLATHLRAVSEQLHDASFESPTYQAPSSGLIDSEQAGKRRRRMAKVYDELLAQARMLSGFEDFLQPIKASALVRATQSGPIVVINCHKGRCDALLILPGQDDIKHLPLPDFNQEKAQHARAELEASLRRKGLRERGFKILQAADQKDSIPDVLAALWRDVVKPVLDFLKYTSSASANNLPHITWCPTGALSFLPLHAAGVYDQPQSRVFDYTISSYTPTLAALLASTPSLFSRASRVLAIGQAKTPGHTPLPGKLLDNQATTAAVLDAMEQHDWVHLACHAHQNVQDPTKSGFFLHDGTLDLAAINRRSFKNKGLAFLSACQTATGDEKLPDEAIHLASGMLMAFVADKVYERLMNDGKVGNGEAGKALHYAYIHIGS